MKPWQTARLLVPWPALLGMALVALGIEIAALMSQRDVLLSWVSLVEAADGAWPVVGILVVGCAAAIAVRPLQNRELTAALPDSGARTVAATGLVVGLAGAAVHVLTVAGLLVWGWTSGLPGHPRLMPIVSVLVGLVACALFGTAVARFRLGLITPLLAMGLFVACLFVIRAFGGRSLVDLGGVSVVLVGLAPDREAVLWRAVWLSGAGAIAWYFAAYGRLALRRLAFWLLVPATIAVAVTAEQKANTGFTETSVVWVCDSGPPKVCVAAEYDHRLEEYAAAIAELAPHADRVGLPQPARGYRQTVGITPGVGSFNVAAQVNGWQLAFDLVQFSFPCSEQWNEPQLQRAERVTAWLAVQVGIPLPPDPELQVPSLRSAQQDLDGLACRQ